MPIFCWAYFYLYTFMESDCSVFDGKFIRSALISIYFACWWTAASTEDVTPFSDMENQFKTCILQIVSSQRASLNILKVCDIFHQFEENLMSACCFFKSAIIYVHKNCRWNNTHLYWIHYSKITCAVVLFHGGNDSATTHSSRN